MVLHVFTPRRIMPNRTNECDGTLEKVKVKEDPNFKHLHHVVKKLRNQVDQLTIGKAEMEKDHMNVLSLIEKEKDDELNLMKARIKKTELMNSFLKVSKNSLAEKIAIQHKQKSSSRNNVTEIKRDEGVTHHEIACDATEEFPLSSKPMVEEKKLEETLGEIMHQEQDTQSEKRNSAPMNNNVNNKVTEETVLQLCDMHANAQMVKRDSNGVEQNTSLKEQIQVIVNNCLDQTRQDAENSLLQQDKKIDALKEELDASKKITITMDVDNRCHEDIVQLPTPQLDETESESINLEKKLEEKEKEVEKSSHDGIAQIHARKLNEQESEMAKLNEKLDDKELEVKRLKEHYRDNVTLLPGEEKSTVTNLQSQVPLKVGINQMNQASNECVDQTKQDEANSLLQQDKIINTLKEELNASRRNALRMEIENIGHKGIVQVITRQLEKEESDSTHLQEKLDEKEIEVKKLSSKGIVPLLTRQLEEQESEFVKPYDKLHSDFVRLNKQYNEQDNEGKELKEYDRNDLALLQREGKSAEANLQAQLQQKEEVIIEINQAANNLLTCQETVFEQNHVAGKSVEANLQAQLQQKQEFIIAAKKLLSCQEPLFEQTSVAEIEELKAIIQQKDLKIESIVIEKENKIASIEEREIGFHRIVQKHQSKLDKLDKLRQRYEAELEQSITDRESDSHMKREEDERLVEAAFQRNILNHEDCLSNQGAEIAELKKNLEAQILKCQNEYCSDEEENESETILE